MTNKNIKEIVLLTPDTSKERIDELIKFLEPVCLEVKPTFSDILGIESSFDATQKYVLDSLSKFDNGQRILYAIDTTNNKIVGFKKFSFPIDEELADMYIKIYQRSIPGIVNIRGNPIANITFIDKDSRGQGIARNLEESMIKNLERECAKKEIYTRVPTSNDASWERLIKFGYGIVGSVYPDREGRPKYDEGTVWFKRKY